MRLEPTHVIRRRDLVDLFDTTPDLAGNDIDISRFIRSGEELDVRVFWRDVPRGQPPDPDEEHGTGPHRQELCPVPVGAFRKFATSKNKRGDVWCWDGIERKWRRPEEGEIYPGQTFMVRVDAGGYDSEVGWSPDSRKAVVEDVSATEPDSHGHDFESGRWISIGDHTDDVMAELNAILEQLDIEEDLKRVLLQAARWHDRGKAHATFQEAVKAESRPDEWKNRVDVAKAPNEFWGRYGRRGFRHELASALAMMQEGKPDLALYLVAAHHGKVRLSIRSLPNEKPPPGEPGRLHARGIWDEDCLPAVDLGGGEVAPPVNLSLECMQLGRAADANPSWVERMLRLREEYGPFRLAYLEAMLRAADMRASRKEAAEARGK